MSPRAPVDENENDVANAHDAGENTNAISLRERLRELRRPVILTTISVVCLVTHHILLRAMAHGHIAHVLLGAGNASPPAGAALLAIALVVVRFITFILVPGLMLAAAAEVVAYLLVGPRRSLNAAEEDDLDPLSDVESAIDGDAFRDHDERAD